MGVTAAMTLATLENGQYLFSNFYRSGTFLGPPNSPGCCASVLSIAFGTVLRDLCSVTLHGSTGVLIGAGIGKARETGQKVCFQIPRILLLPVAFHTLFDASLIWSALEVHRTGNERYALSLGVAGGALSLAFALAIWKVKLFNRLQTFAAYDL